MLDALPVVIREATRGDAETLFELQRASALAGFAHIFPPNYYPFPDDAERRAWADLLQTPDVSVLVAERQEGAVGVAVVESEELLRFFILPNEWGTGVAGVLHDAVMGLVRSRGESVCRLWVLEDNRCARRFYERRGWKLDGRTKGAKFPPFPPTVGYTLSLLDR